MLSRASSRASRTSRAGPVATAKSKPRFPSHNLPRREKTRILRRRIERAERDERIDIGTVLTPSRTYMGGFTRPRHLRTLAWCKGGQYQRKGKYYEMPPPDAYEPHTVYLLEGRYYSAHTVGRSDSLEHVVGVCRESDVLDTIKRHNSSLTTAKAFRAMDFAHWPWLPPRAKRIKWWQDDENPDEIVKEIHEGAAAFGLETSTGPATTTALQPTPVLTAGFNRGQHGQQIRAFHSSARVLTPTSYNEDHVVPDFYVRHKQHRAKQTSEQSSATPSPSPVATTPPAARKARKHEAAGLMQHLSDSILSDEIAANTRRLKTKIPVEHYDAEGNLILHPSGFVVPGNGHSSTSDVARAKERQRDEDEDRAAQTAAVAERVLESDFDHVHAAMASTRPRSHKVPFEVREPDGVVKHPSGFVPPTPAHEFKYSDSASLDRDLRAAVGRQRAREASVGKDRRGFHTTAVSRASVSDIPVPLDLSAYSGQKLHKQLEDPTEIRSQYMPTLAHTPFFRPLLTITLATRPLADNIARLARAGPRGVSYVAAIREDERKSGASFSTRVRNMRLNRMMSLSTQLAQLLLGARGGLMGMRLAHHDRGRGVNGEGLEKPLPWEKRVIGVGVGNWYARAGEIKEGFKEDGDNLVNRLFAVEGEEKPVFKVYGLDDWGRRIADETGEEIPYPPQSPPSMSSAAFALDLAKAVEAEEAEAAAKASKKSLKK
ncbi:hypothetical protein F5I97DRAFT_1807819 [Phlebopus sp. FC_14]|nr:hypothetical protein F5I97DRAFT_1807819 [Phlebopus sp. FC_14]